MPCKLCTPEYGFVLGPGEVALSEPKPAGRTAIYRTRKDEPVWSVDVVCQAQDKKHPRAQGCGAKRTVHGLFPSGAKDKPEGRMRTIP